MIIIKFVSSPDTDLNGEVTYNFNRLVIGRSKKCDLIIEDSTCALKHIELSLNPQGLYCQLLDSKNIFFHNSKKNITKRLIKDSDEIQIGNTKIQIVKSQFVPLPDRQEELKNRYLNLIKESEQKKALLDRLEKEMISAR